jgi:predicted phosphodiesterase
MRVWRLVAAAFGCLALALVGCALGTRLAGERVHETALGEVSLSVEPSISGRVDVFIPLANWGMRARAFDAPIEIEVVARSVKRSALLKAVGGDRAVLDDARRDAEAAADDELRRMILWCTLTTIVLAALIAALLGNRLGSGRVRAGLVAAATTLSLLMSGAAAWLAGATFDASALEQPDFYARGAELGQLLEVAEEGQEAASGYESSVDRTLAGFARVLSGAARLTGREEPDSIALASDLHGNPLVLEPLIGVFGRQPVFFAGDFAHAGTEAEADLLAERVSRLGSPVVAVSGNHDSSLFMDRLADSGVIVLDGEEVIDVAGHKVAGWPDPLEWTGPEPDDPDRIFSFGERPGGDEDFENAERDLIAWFEALEDRPEIVVVHQNGLAQGLASHVADSGQGPLTVLTGHDHRQHVDRYDDGVVVVDAGSTGAGGAFGVGTQAIGVGNLHFTEAGLRAVDLTLIEPLSGEARAERIVPAADMACEKDLLVCHDEEEEPERDEREDPPESR